MSPIQQRGRAGQAMSPEKQEREPKRAEHGTEREQMRFVGP